MSKSKYQYQLASRSQLQAGITEITAPSLPLHKKTNSYLGYQNEGAFQQMKSMWQQDFDPKLTLIKTPSQEPSCKHAELISYKVHKDQFKSLLVAPTIRQKLYKETKKMEAESVSHRETSECDTTQNESASEDECMSTDGDESDPNSPLCPDSQYINQSNDLRAALINSKALVGDYVELKNCKRCGAMIFKDQSSSIKSKQEEFNADISPAQLLTKMFQDETRYQVDHFIKNADPVLHKPAKIYTEQRSSLVIRMFQMGAKFHQRIKTTHIGIELMDRYFLDKRSQNDKDIQSMSPRAVTIVLTTCFLIASKYDEIDDHLVFINDVQRYYARMPQYQGQSPTYNDIVETERMLMNFFGWDLGFVMPIHYVEIFLANGVLFESEYNKNIVKTKDTAKKISDKAYELLDEMIKQNLCFKNKGFSGNQVASMIIYVARQEVLNLSRSRHVWPKELQLISRQTEKQVKKLASIYKKGARTHRVEPFATDDLKSGRFYPLTQAIEPVLSSPKAKIIIDHEHHISCEKKQNDILAAAPVIPTTKKIQMSSNTKVNDYKYKSQIASTLENAKNMPFRSKNQSRLGKMPNSNQKLPSRGSHFISAQKCEDGSTKLKVFAERRISTNTRLLSSKFQNDASSLRIQQPSFRSGQKVCHIASQKSFSNISNLHRDRDTNSGGLRGRNEPASTSIVAPLKSARQDIIGFNCQSTKNSGVSASFNAKLQSKYGIKAQNQLFSTSNGGKRGHYQSSLGHQKGSQPYAYNRTNTSKELVAMKDNFVRREISESREMRRTSIASKQRVLSTDVDLRVRNQIRHQSICENRPPMAGTKGIKDIREARTAQEVREIMSQVNNRYNNGAKFL